MKNYYKKMNKIIILTPKVIFITDKTKQLFDDDISDEELYERIKEMNALRKGIKEKIKALEENSDEESLEKINKIREFYKNSNNDNLNLENLNEEDRKKLEDLNGINPKLGMFRRFVNAFEKDVNIDPGRLLGLTDGIFGMVMTLLIFGMALPESQISNYTGFINFVNSLAPTIGLTLVSFILLATFWIYHHEFIKIKNLNMPYLWLNIFYLASISFIPFTTSIVGNYSHFFLANVIFGANILITNIFFLLMFHYAYRKGFLEDDVSKEERKYIYHTLYMIMGTTIAVNLLDFNISHNFIYLFFLIPIISIIRDINYRLRHE